MVKPEKLEIFSSTNFVLQVPSSSGTGYLRVLTPSDVSGAYVQGMNDPEVTMWLDGVKNNVQTYEVIVEYVLQNLNDACSVLLGFYLNETLRGTVRLHELDRKERSVTIGIALFDRTLWGLGFGCRLIEAVSAAGFETGLIDRIYAGIDERNLASQRTFEKAGFTATELNAYDYKYGRALKFKKEI
ncbi:GNAT family N-acetyltransferase [Thalassospira lucentensis]|uniref:GNAT family N-acetyltransferase n=1 Tax=Thalassospira lucentensis TaxID=168935 RepID=UPI003D2D8338